MHIIIISLPIEKLAVCLKRDHTILYTMDVIMTTGSWLSHTSKDILQGENNVIKDPYRTIEIYGLPVIFVIGIVGNGLDGFSNHVEGLTHIFERFIPVLFRHVQRPATS